MPTFRTSSGTDITYTEFVDMGRPGASPVMDFGPEGSRAVRVVDVDWEDWKTFYREVIGYAKLGRTGAIEDLGGSASRPYIKRVNPWAFPLDGYSNGDNGTNVPFLFASRCSIAGIGKPGKSSESDLASYDKARFTISFDTRLYDILSDQQMAQYDYDESSLARYVTKVYEPSGEFLNLDGSAYYYAYGNNGAKPVTRGINKTLIYFNIQLTWHGIPVDAVPTEFLNDGCTNPAIDFCLGRVNSQDFGGYRIGTLLLTAARIKPIVNAVGDRCFDVTYFFKFFNPTKTERNGWPVGHQHIFNPRAATPGWYEVLAGETGKTRANSSSPTNFVANTEGMSIFDWANFDNLFRPANYPAVD